MLLKQQFKTLEGAQKRCRFENAHCDGKYTFKTVRCVNGEYDPHPFGAHDMHKYTWRLEKTKRVKLRGSV